MADVSLPHASVREAIALAIQVIVHIKREGGRRVVTEAVRVRGYDAAASRFELDPLPSSPLSKEPAHG
jgi:hypothetical protein